MAEILRDVNQEGRPLFKYRTTLELLAEQLFEEKCLIFLGAGASVDQGNPALPTARELSKDLAAKCALEWHEYVPLSTTAFYYEFFYDRASLNRFLTDRITAPGIPPATTIETLVQIIGRLEDRGKKCLVVTTNYDQQFEKAYYTARKREPGVIIYRGANDPSVKGVRLHDRLSGPPEYWFPSKPTYLYKMHGCISDPGEQNLVITEEDYINFLTNSLSQDENKRLLHYVRGRLALSTVLFIGYSLSDWNFRVLFKATAEDKSTTSFAVQLNTPSSDTLERTRQQALVKFWGLRRIDIINAEAAQFTSDLLAHIDSYQLQSS